MTYFAPAGTPVTLGDIARGLTGGPETAEAALVGTLRRLTGLTHAWPISSGRAAMTVILQAMRDARGDGKRDEVIIPAYTCYSVPAAIERAGLKPRLCDIDPGTLGMDPDELERRDFSRVLAVISANLYGLPNELPGIEAVCRRRGVFLLDDAAQALGASLNGRAVGSFGDAGLFSFDKGKIISTIQGGAIVCRQETIATRLGSFFAAAPRAALGDSLGNLAKLIVYSIFLRPRLYGLIRRLPFTGLGHTRYETRYPVTKLARWQLGVAVQLLARLATLHQGRRQHAGWYQAALDGVPGIESVRVVPNARPAYARYPFRLRDPERRERLLAELDRTGIGATASYPLSLADVPQVAAKVPPGDLDCPGARQVARTIVTVPTHAYCPPDIAEHVRKAVIQCLA